MDDDDGVREYVLRTAEGLATARSRTLRAEIAGLTHGSFTIRNRELFNILRNQITAEFDRLDAAIDAEKRKTEGAAVAEESRALETARSLKASFHAEIVAQQRAALGAEVRLVAADGRVFRAAKDALVAASPFFERSLDGPYAEADRLEVAFDEDGAVLETALLGILCGSACKAAYEKTAVGVLCRTAGLLARLERHADLATLLEVLEEGGAAPATADAASLFDCASLHRDGLLDGEAFAVERARWDALRACAVKAVAHRVEDADVAELAPHFLNAVGDAVEDSPADVVDFDAATLAEAEAGVAFQGAQGWTCTIRVDFDKKRIRVSDVSADFPGGGLKGASIILRDKDNDLIDCWTLTKGKVGSASLKLKLTPDTTSQIRASAETLRFSVDLSRPAFARRLFLAYRWAASRDESATNCFRALRVVASLDAPPASLLAPLLEECAEAFPAADVLALPASAVVDLVLRDDLAVADELVVLKTCLAWARARDDAAAALDGLLPHVRLPFVRPRRLKDELPAGDLALLKGRPAFAGLMAEALDFQTGKRTRDRPGDGAGRRHKKRRDSGAIPTLTSAEILAMVL